MVFGEMTALATSSIIAASVHYPIQVHDLVNYFACSYNVAAIYAKTFMVCRGVCVETS